MPIGIRIVMALGFAVMYAGLLTVGSVLMIVTVSDGQSLRLSVTVVARDNGTNIISTVKRRMLLVPSTTPCASVHS